MDAPKLGRGRPTLPPGERKVSQGIRLSPAAWARLAELAEQAGTTQSEVLESLILPPEPR